MSYNSHINSLIQRNFEVNRRILKELKRPYPNEYRLRELKKERLRLQDVIYLVEG